MSAPTVSRPTNARIMRLLMRYLPLDGGYSLDLQVGGANFATPVTSGGICNEGIESALLQLYSKVLSGRKGTFLDIGANVGQTLLALKSVRPDMPYLGCEPNGTCVAYLRQLIQRNGIKDATVLPVAVMDQPGLLELQLFFDHEADSSASLVAGVRPDQKVARTLHVPGYTWEQVSTVMKDDAVGFVKIDVEGAELEVLRTIEPLLQAQRPWMLIEILPAYSADYSDRLDRQTQIEALLARQGYALLRVRKDHANHNLTHLEMLETIGVHGDISECDYLIVPSEEVPQVAAGGLRIDQPS